MISLKKYLDSAAVAANGYGEPEEGSFVSVALSAYGSALLEMGSCSLDACPGLGDELQRNLRGLNGRLSTGMGCVALAATDKDVREQLRGWGRRTARHYQQKSDEVKELLIVMASTAEGVGARDQRCAGQINEVTTRLKAIASLEDLTEIRASIEKSAAELKTSIERMTAEGRAAIDGLRKQVSTYQARLEEAEEIASRDALTGLRSRLCVENQIERRTAEGALFSVAMVDIDGFKKVNDELGHLAGDEMLKQFAAELVSACRSTDVIGRWGGDEFIILLASDMEEAGAQADRLKKWVCGDYTLQEQAGARKVRVDASIGLAEHRPGETMKDLLARADAAMYEHKAASRSLKSGALE
jgi:diguanylate cyclase (GGDEF)-like protein